MKVRAAGSSLVLLAAVAAAATPAPAPERPLPSPLPVRPAKSELKSYALVLTNNRSLAAERPDLQYADDDGAQYADFFAQLYGDERVTLLTSFDAPSLATHGRWAERVRPPTAAELALAVRQLGVTLRADRSAGRRTQVLIVFAGHGDLDRGAGFIDLEDRRLTAAELERDVLAGLPADRLHLIIDSCNSYFMLNPRKPGGKRWEVQVEAPKGLLERTASIGAIVSTSAEALTYEWSELQSGIFSYEVRSGLRGAADADGDGRVTYVELAAFIQVANRRVPNDLYRPKVFARGPGGDGDEVLVDLRSAAARRLTVNSPSSRRLTVRSELGVRVSDVHTEAGAAVTLLLPTRGPLYLAETVAPAPGGGDRPALRQRSLAEGSFEVTLDAIPSDPVALVERGDLPV